MEGPATAEILSGLVSRPAGGDSGQLAWLVAGKHSLKQMKHGVEAQNQSFCVLSGPRLFREWSGLFPSAARIRVYPFFSGSEKGKSVAIREGQCKSSVPLLHRYIGSLSDKSGKPSSLQYTAFYLDSLYRPHFGSAGSFLGWLTQLSETLVYCSLSASWRGVGVIQTCFSLMVQ